MIQKNIVDGRWAFKIGGGKRNSTFGYVDSKDMNGQNCTYNVIYKQAPKSKASHFYCSMVCC